MNRNITKYCIVAFAYIAVLYPVAIYIRGAEWAWNSTLLVELFPVFGFLAFGLLWLHAISGVFEPWLRQHIDFDSYVNSTASLILISLILHPLLLLIALKFDFGSLWFSTNSFYIRLAVIAWLLLITYDIAKPLKKRYGFFARHWNKILLISTIGFLLTFFHSLGIGDDLQQGPLRIVWIGYGVTAILATIYTYGIKNFYKR